MVVSIVLTLAFVALFLGSRQTHNPREYRAYPDGVVDESVLAARTNAELAENPFRATQTAWTPAPPALRTVVTPRDPEGYAAVMRARAQRRAYEGAPPTIPHGVAEDTAAACNVCHQSGAQVAGSVAPVYGHAAFTMCMQCHVPSTPPLAGLEGSSTAASVASTFRGLAGAPHRYQWTSSSPPQLPHTTWMREDCNACHGPAGRPGLQTAHPERQVCQQCHAPSAWLDQRGPR